MRWLGLALFTVTLGTSAPAAPEWRRANDVEVQISSFDIQPSKIKLKAGEPVRLRLYNQSGQTHIFAAPRFFAAAKARNRDAKELSDGVVRVEPGEAVEVVLVPAPGSYKIRSSNFFYRIMGMRGEIVVQ